MSKKKRLPPGVRYRDGRYTFRYSVTVIENGKKRRKQKETRSFATAKEAYEEGIKIKAKLLAGERLDASNITFEDWVERWLEDYSNTGVKESTIISRRYCLRPALKKFRGVKLKDITAADYQALLNERKAAGVSKSALLGLHVPMKMLFRAAASKPYEIIPRDITQDVRFPTYQETVEDLERDDLPKFLEKIQLIKLLESTKNAETFAERQIHRIIYVLAYTGLRVGELCALMPGDIDHVNAQIRITKTLYDRQGIQKYKLLTPKTKRPRKVDVPKSVLKVLDEQLKERKLYMMSRMNEFYMEKEFIFINTYELPGYPIGAKTIREQMSECLRRAGLPQQFTPHSLRHTYTSLMAEAGADLEYIQRQLGHVKDRMTRTVYLHITESKRKTEMEKFEAFMRGL